MNKAVDKAIDRLVEHDDYITHDSEVNSLGDKQKVLAAVQELRVQDVRELLDKTDAPITVRDMKHALWQAHPDRWTTYEPFSRFYSQCAMNALNRFKDELIVGEIKKHHRGRGCNGIGGMGGTERFKTYMLKSKAGSA